MVVFIVFGMVAFMIGGSEAITCYSCNSTTTTNCLDPFSPTGVHTCTGAACLKALVSVSGTTFVTRQCHPNEAEKDLCLDTSGEGISGKGCVCRSDNCNDAGMLKPTYKILVAVFTVMAITLVNEI